MKYGFRPRNCPRAIPWAKTIFHGMSLLSSTYCYIIHLNYVNLIIIIRKIKYLQHSYLQKVCSCLFDECLRSSHCFWAWHVSLDTRHTVTKELTETCNPSVVHAAFSKQSRLLYFRNITVTECSGFILQYIECFCNSEHFVIPRGHFLKYRK